MAGHRHSENLALGANRCSRGLRCRTKSGVRASWSCLECFGTGDNKKAPDREGRCRVIFTVGMVGVRCT